MVSTALTDWHENPVITSVDSIAAPIDLIQFPTITVCHEESRQPDNWAFLETILSNQSEECGYHDCKITQKTRENFSFVFKQLVEEFRRWLFNEKILLSEIIHELPLKPFECNGKSVNPIHAISNKVCELVKDKTMSINELKNLPIEYFAKSTQFTWILDHHWKRNFTEFYDDWIGNECSSNECRNKLVPVLVRLLHVMTSNEIGNFGVFLSYFLNKIKLDDKESDKNTLKHGKIEENSLYGICSIGKNEEFIQEYFTNLSKLVGLEDNEAVTLYDIPSMLSNANYESVSLFQHNLLYSRCKDTENAEMKNNPSMYCLREWRKLFDTGKDFPCFFTK